MIQNWPPWLNFTPPPKQETHFEAHRSYTPAPLRSPRRSAGIAPYVSPQHPLHKPAELQTEVVPGPMATPSPASLTFGGEPDERRHATEMVAKVQDQLNKIDRQGLDGTRATTYDQARGFVHQAQQAIEQKDYAAASGFAKKASLLTEKLATNTR